jgi:hypothetical protein
MDSVILESVVFDPEDIKLHFDKHQTPSTRKEYVRQYELFFGYLNRTQSVQRITLDMLLNNLLEYINTMSHPKTKAPMADKTKIKAMSLLMASFSDFDRKALGADDRYTTLHHTRSEMQKLVDQKRNTNADSRIIDEPMSSDTTIQRIENRANQDKILGACIMKSMTSNVNGKQLDKPLYYCPRIKELHSFELVDQITDDMPVGCWIDRQGECLLTERKVTGRSSDGRDCSVRFIMDKSDKLLELLAGRENGKLFEGTCYNTFKSWTQDMTGGLGIHEFRAWGNEKARQDGL